MVKLIDSGIIDELQITILGISADSLYKIRNHSLLKELTEELNIPTPASQTVASWHEAQQFINAEMFPLFVHSESSVAGKGNYLATSDRHLKNIVKNGLAVSPVHQVTLEQSMAGKKEVHLTYYGMLTVIRLSLVVVKILNQSVFILGILLVLFRCKQLVINFSKNAY